MIRATRIALALAAASTFGGMTLARTALADPPSAKAAPVYVLSLSTDDADDQADALTQALRARVRTAPGWSLLETPQSFETLSIALKCPAKPDGPCLQRIADQIHSDHFMWGTMKKKGGQVTAVVHLWTRGSGDQTTSNAYSDNLKDPSDESLRRIATTVFSALTGTVVASTGTIVVHAGHEGGEVLVDGNSKATLQAGVASIDLPPGAHTVAVHVPGFDSPSQSMSVVSGAQTDMTFRLSTPGGSETPESSSSFPIRKVLTYSALVVGGAFIIVGGVEAAQWISDSNASSNDLSHVPPSNNNVCNNQNSTYAQDACQKDLDAKKVSAIGVTFGALGVALVGTGIILLVTDHHNSDSTPDAGTAPAAKNKVDILPVIGTRGGALNLSVTF